MMVSKVAETGHVRVLTLPPEFLGLTRVEVPGGVCVGRVVVVVARPAGVVGAGGRGGRLAGRLHLHPGVEAQLG